MVFHPSFIPQEEPRIVSNVAAVSELHKCWRSQSSLSGSQMMPANHSSFLHKAFDPKL